MKNWKTILVALAAISAASFASAQENAAAPASANAQAAATEVPSKFGKIVVSKQVVDGKTVARAVIAALPSNADASEVISSLSAAIAGVVNPDHAAAVKAFAVASAGVPFSDATGKPVSIDAIFPASQAPDIRLNFGSEKAVFNPQLNLVEGSVNVAGKLVVTDASGKASEKGVDLNVSPDGESVAGTVDGSKVEVSAPSVAQDPNADTGSVSAPTAESNNGVDGAINTTILLTDEDLSKL